MSRPSAIIFCIAVILCFSGCKTRPNAFPSNWRRTVQKGEVLSTFFETGEGEVFLVPDDQLDAMPPCDATVLRKLPCAALLRTGDGAMLSIGGPGATAAVSSFVETLENGRMYTFPHAFVEYQER